MGEILESKNPNPEKMPEEAIVAVVEEETIEVMTEVAEVEMIEVVEEVETKVEEDNKMYPLVIPDFT